MIEERFEIAGVVAEKEETFAVGAVGDFFVVFDFPDGFTVDAVNEWWVERLGDVAGGRLMDMGFTIYDFGFTRCGA